MNRFLTSYCALASLGLAFPLHAQEVTTLMEDDYGDAYKLKVTVTNTTANALTSWLVRLDLGAGVDNSWNCTPIPDEDDAANHVYAFANADFNGDLEPGQSESFGMIVNNPDSASAPTTGVFVPDWVPNLTPTITGSNVSVLETDSAGALASLTFTLNTSVDQAVTFDYLAQSGTATVGEDFDAASGTVTFPVGTLAQTISIPITGDDLDEGTENFTVTLSNAANAELAQASVTVTILNDDAPPSETGGKPQTGKYNYAEVLQKSLWFYDAQRSGDLPDDFRVPWRGDSALDDGSDVGLDLTGGLYDAGDHVKFGLPMAYSLTMLSWGAIEYREAYEETRQWDELVSLMEFAADYFMRCHQRDAAGRTTAFYGQVGDGHADHAFWGPAEDMTMDRPAFKIDAANPGSDLAAETAASLAAMSIALQDENPTLAAEMVTHARALYSFAELYPGRYSDSIENAFSFYRSFSGYDDEMIWGALWLYRATGEAQYLTKATSNWGDIDYRTDGLSWDDKSCGAYVLMAQLNGGSVYRDSAERFLDNWSQDNPTSNPLKTPGGLVSKFPWGSLRHATTQAMCALIYADRVADPEGNYFNFARRQMRYALGDNPANRSYVCGFGINPPANPHHRSAHDSPGYNINSPVTNTHVLYGALVGGPDENDGYVDDRTDFQLNEVAMDYNAGFTGAAAALYLRYGGAPVADLASTTPIDPDFVDPTDPVDPPTGGPLDPLEPPTGGYAPQVAPEFDITASNRIDPDPELYDWSRAGYRGTGVLPGASARTHQINATDFGVIADDGLDDSAALQAAINSAASLTRDFDNLAVVNLPAGEINVSKQISMHLSYVILKGAGSDPATPTSTRVVFRPDEDTRYDRITTDSNGPLPDFNAMSHNGNDLDWNWPGRGLFKVQTLAVHDSYTTSYATAPDNRKDIFEGSVNFHWKAGLHVLQNGGLVAAAGSTVIPLDSSVPDRKINALEVGMSVVVKAADTKNMFLEQEVASQYWRDLFMKMQMFRITAIDPENKMITLDKPLEFDLYANNFADGSSAIGGGERESRVVPLDLVEGVGFEDLFLTQPMVNAPKLGGGTYNFTWEDAARNYTNIAPEYTMHGIVFRWAADSWVKNVRTFMTGSHAIVTEEARNLQIEDSVFEGSWNKGAGGNGYFRLSRAWDSLVHHNTLRQLRHITLQWSASGNVIIGNHIDCDINFHGGWERHNLVEQNVAEVPRDHKPNAGENWYPIWWATGPKAGKWAGSSGPRNVLFRNDLNKQVTTGGPMLPYAPYTESSLPAGTVVQMGWDRDTVVGSRWEHLADGSSYLQDWSGSETRDFSTGNLIGVNNRMIRNADSLFLKPVVSGDYLTWATVTFGEATVNDPTLADTIWGPEVGNNLGQYAFGTETAARIGMGDDHVLLEYTRNKNAGDLTWEIWTSTDLVNWTLVPSNEMTEEALSESTSGSLTYSRQGVTHLREIDLDKQRYYQVRAILAE